MADKPDRETSDLLDLELRSINCFAEVMRDLMRAVAANDATGALYSASTMMQSLSKLIDKELDGVSWYTIFEGSTNLLKADPPVDSSRYEYVDLARACMKYMAELTAPDSFATARMSKARSAVDREIKWVDEARKLRRQGFDSPR